MEWSNESVFQFLEAFQVEPSIWNPMHYDHKHRNVVADAWKRIHEKLNFDCTIEELKKKKDSLMASFRMLLRKKKESLKSGDADVFKPNWFAYAFMESFLGPVYHCNPTAYIEAYTKEEDSSNQSVRNEIETEVLIEETDDDNINSKSVNSESRDYSNKRSNNTNTMEKRLDEVYKLLKEESTNKKKRAEEEDECDAYATLLAKKLRKFNDVEREIIMNEIDNLIFQKRILSRCGKYINNT